MVRPTVSLEAKEASRSGSTQGTPAAESLDFDLDQREKKGNAPQFPPRVPKRAAKGIHYSNTLRHAAALGHQYKAVREEARLHSATLPCVLTPYKFRAETTWFDIQEKGSPAGRPRCTRLSRWVIGPLVSRDRSFPCRREKNSNLPDVRAFNCHSAVIFLQVMT